MRSFGTHFNAFPASYRRRWTPVRRIRLPIRTAGTGHLVVMRSTARGTLQRQESRSVDGTGEQVFELPLTAFGDGGWYWFDAYAGSGEDRKRTRLNSSHVTISYAVVCLKNKC